MLGVIRDDQPISAVVEYFESVPFENLFVSGRDGRVACEIEQLGWRRFLLHNTNPNLSIAEAVRLMETLGLKPGGPEFCDATASLRLRRLVPTLDFTRRIRSVAVADQTCPETVDAHGLIMAGGFGRRLGEMTKTVPKPMLKVAGKPIAEHLVDNLVDNGIRDIFMSVFHLGHVVKEHFRDGRDHGCRVSYLEETSPLGTAGCLSLLGEAIEKPLLVINGDVVTTLQLSRLLAFHNSNGADVTMAVRRHTVPIPFGVVEHAGGLVQSIREKPRLSYDINVAIYVLSPVVLRYVQAGQKADMPDFIQSLLPMGYKVMTFPLFESWIDVGTVGDFTRAGETYDPAIRPRLTPDPSQATTPAAALQWHAAEQVAEAR